MRAQREPNARVLDLFALGAYIPRMSVAIRKPSHDESLPPEAAEKEWQAQGENMSDPEIRFCRCGWLCRWDDNGRAIRHAAIELSSCWSGRSSARRNLRLSRSIGQNGSSGSPELSTFLEFQPSLLHFRDPDRGAGADGAMSWV